MDLLADLPATAGLFLLGRFSDELLHVPVDVVPDESLKPRVRASIEADQVPL